MKDDEIRVTLKSTLEELPRIEQISNEIADRMGLNEDQRDNLSIAVTEAVGNAIVHGNKKDPEKKVYVRFRISGDHLTFSVTDEGRGFDPDSLDNPLDPANLMKESGRGIFILKALMQNVRFDFTENGTTLSFELTREK